MRLRPLPILALVLLLAAGCGQLTPLQSASVAADSLSATQTALETANRAGLLSDKALLDTEPFDFAAHAAVAEMFARAEAGDADAWPSQFWHANRAFWESLAKLKTVQQTAERNAKLPAAVKPVPSVDEEPRP